MALKTLERPALRVVGLQIQTEPMSPEIPALWPRFVPRMAEIPNRSEPRVAYGLMWHQQGSMAVLHYMAAVAVSKPGRIPEGMVSLVIPAGTYTSVRYPLSGLGKGFGEIFDRLLPASEYVQVPGPYFERYDESFCPDDPGSLVEICLPVQPRRAAMNS